MKRKLTVLLQFILTLAISISCSEKSKNKTWKLDQTSIPENVLNYNGVPKDSSDRSFLAFSDKGAWFAYSLNDEKNGAGFSGPFIMTQDNGIWSSKNLSKLDLFNAESKKLIDFKEFKKENLAYNSHLLQILSNEKLEIRQFLFYPTPHSAIIAHRITNKGKNNIELRAELSGSVLSPSLFFEKQDESIVKIKSKRSNANGFIQLHTNIDGLKTQGDSAYLASMSSIALKPNECKEIVYSHSFILPEYNTKEELDKLQNLAKNYQNLLLKSISDKEMQLQKLYAKLDSSFNKKEYKNLLAKAILTLQNNWRVATGELKHSGVFPSYHYIWFHGFWAWDSWKHAVALAHIDTKLAKNQIRAMYDFQLENGFIVDCIYRDTTIEKHNYRNSKPPLSAWAVWEVFEEDNDTGFLKELYPKIVKQHEWWYEFRDYDRDSLCEYGSTDGTLIAAKWESGMDNAVRFDNSKLLKTNEWAFSMNQESVDLNSYLYAEKRLLAKMAKLLKNESETKRLLGEALVLKSKIQDKFFDKETGWFYDISIDGKEFIKVMGCEGWLTLWAEVATEEQAGAVMKNMLDTNIFNTKVPLQTLAANHKKFKPHRGYWRGPNWLDQSYFGINGLKNYEYSKEANMLAYKLIHNAEGVLEKGKSIRENYNPITGAGMEAQNFSWSAAHYLLLLINE